MPLVHIPPVLPKSSYDFAPLSRFNEMLWSESSKKVSFVVVVPSLILIV